MKGYHASQIVPLRVNLFAQESAAYTSANVGPQQTRYCCTLLASAKAYASHAADDTVRASHLSKQQTRAAGAGGASGQQLHQIHQQQASSNISVMSRPGSQNRQCTETDAPAIIPQIQTNALGDLLGRHRVSK